MPVEEPTCLYHMLQHVDPLPDFVNDVNRAGALKLFAQKVAALLERCQK